MFWMNIVNIVAVIAAPIVAVWVGQKLQDRQLKRKDKIELFKTLMISRNGWTVESVRALNVLDVVFSDDEKVRNAWKNYYDKLCVDNTNDSELKKIQDAQYELLDTMAQSLGYKDKITWKTIQNPYKPKGMDILEQNQKEYQEGQLAWAEFAKKVVNMPFPFQPVSVQEKNGDKHQEG